MLGRDGKKVPEKKNWSNIIICVKKSRYTVYMIAVVGA